MGWIQGAGAFLLPGEDPDSHQTGSIVVKHVTKLAFKTRKMFLFVWDLAFFLIRGAKLGSKPEGGMGDAGWIHARKESGK